METKMGFRLVALLAAATLSSAGFTAAAWSLTRGETDQAIAFGWPALAVAITVAVLIPVGKRPGSPR
jgi:uncharacterized membrane protein YkvI